MRIYHASIFSCIFALLLLFTACGGDDEGDSFQTKQDILANGIWLLVAWTTTDMDSTVVDQFQVINDCRLDDEYRFTIEGDLEYLEGPSKCQINDPDQRTGTWALNDMLTTLTFTDPDGEVTAHEIINISAGELKLRYQRTISNSVFTHEQTYWPKP